jgi:hypothetical protein
LYNVDEIRDIDGDKQKTVYTVDGIFSAGNEREDYHCAGADDDQKVRITDDPERQVDNG